MKREKASKYACYMVDEILTTYRRTGNTPLTGPGWFGSVIRREVYPVKIRLVRREVELFGIRSAIRQEQMRRLYRENSRSE